MSIENARDPRTAMVRTKYFSLHPKPLERWLWQQGLPQAAERVFWLHWEEGMRSGDWCSEIPIKRVARECCVNPSTVTRAYQILKARGLIRREDPGRNPENPFQQATAITEVRLPRELLTELSRSPNRAKPASQPQSNPTAAVSEPSYLEASSATAAAPTRAKLAPTASSRRRPTREQTQALWQRASLAERARFFAASRDRHTRFDCDPATQLTAEDCEEIHAQLAQQASAVAATQPQPPGANPKPTFAGARRLTALELARARRNILELIPAAGAAEILRQVIWSVEEGALRRFALPLALNIALKKIRDGEWTKPNRLPPQWLPRSALPGRATPEQCSVA